MALLLRNKRPSKSQRAGPDSIWVAILKENSNFIYFCEDTSNTNHLFIHQGRAFGWKIRNPRQSLLEEVQLFGQMDTKPIARI